MKTSLNWIKSFVDIDIPSNELMDLISLNVIEVEQMYKLVSATKLEIGLVKECIKHSNSDHLHVCKVELANGVTQIVCGAANIGVNQKVIVAKVGAVLPGNFTIKKSKIRGEESNGMICSLNELGIEEKYLSKENNEGIYVLDNNASIGECPLKYLGLDDEVIELGLTPNRGDLFSHLGIAYDIAAVLNKNVKYNKIELIETGKNDVAISVKSKNTLAYHVRKVKDVKVKESPYWLKARLIAAGVRPINNIVDITNYVMLELGQPLHAFDADVIGDKIVVRNANKNEKTKTLDDIERILLEEDIVITNDKEIIALGGIMGGLKSSVTINTKNIILESAYFVPQAIRKTASRLGIHSESSQRFERKVDPNRVIMAINLAAKMISDIADGKICKGIISYDILDKKEKVIKLTGQRINSTLGTNITASQLKCIFDRLGFMVTSERDLYIVTVPTRRVDIEHYQDIIEEVARIYGYNNISTTLPVNNNQGKLSEKQKWVRHIRHYLANMGLNETINYSLINKKNVSNFTQSNDAIGLLMPITEDHQTLKQSLINGIVEALKYNKARQVKDLSIFEIGNIYLKKGEELHLACGIMGVSQSLLWKNKKEAADFYFLKGILDSLLNKLGLVAFYEKTNNNGLHPGQTANIIVNNVIVGIIGALHPEIIAENDLDKAYVFSLNLDKLFSLIGSYEMYKEISNQPSISRDLAVVIDKNIAASEVIKLVLSTDKKYLKEVNVFDLYVGNKIGEGLKSIALSLIFQANDKTLLSEDVDKIIKSIIFRLEKDLKAKLRT